jgi:8-oxo-dGTP diphosphatase
VYTSKTMVERKNQRPKQVVAGLIMRDDGKQGRQVLICQRTRHQTMPLKWEFPGGKIEAGEQPRDALVRELEEELGIAAEVGDEVARIRHIYASGSSVELRFYEVPTYRGEIENRIFKQIMWEKFSELPKYDFLEADVELVNQLASGKLLAP